MQWFHGECAGFKADKLPEEGEWWSCPRCTKADFSAEEVSFFASAGSSQRKRKCRPSAKAAAEDLSAGSSNLFKRQRKSCTRKSSLQSRNPLDKQPLKNILDAGIKSYRVAQSSSGVGLRRDVARLVRIQALTLRVDYAFMDLKAGHEGQGHWTLHATSKSLDKKSPEYTERMASRHRAADELNAGALPNLKKNLVQYLNSLFYDTLVGNVVHLFLKVRGFGVLP